MRQSLVARFGRGVGEQGMRQVVEIFTKENKNAYYGIGFG